MWLRQWCVCVFLMRAIKSRTQCMDLTHADRTTTQRLTQNSSCFHAESYCCYCHSTSHYQSCEPWDTSVLQNLICLLNEWPPMQLALYLWFFFMNGLPCNLHCTCDFFKWMASHATCTVLVICVHIVHPSSQLPQKVNFCWEMLFLSCFRVCSLVWLESAHCPLDSNPFGVQPITFWLILLL